MSKETKNTPCSFCGVKYTSADWGEGETHDFRVHDGGLYYYDSQYGWEGIEVKYCPMCGRELEPIQPLTLDELKQMVDEPAYFMNSFGGW